MSADPSDPDALKRQIQERIRREGPLSFAGFMETALYHPQLGYYTRNQPLEDYYTSVDVHGVFAEILARFLHQSWEKLARPNPFALVELGCGWGKLAEGILRRLSANAPECFQAVHYTGIEKSAQRRAACVERTASFGRARFREEFDFPEGSLEGVIFSNEFFDALPVARVRKENGELEEVYVNESLQEVLRPLSPPVQDYFQWLGIEPEEGNNGEAHPAARAWMEKISRALRRGLVLTVDYGFEARELYSEARPEGTAQCHYHHQTNRDFYERIGLQDITAHANFTALAREGERWGLKAERLKTQSGFLLDNGLEDLLRTVQSSAGARARLKATSAVKSLIHPGGMGGLFKVQIQEKIPG